LISSLLCSCASISVKNVDRQATKKPTARPTHFFVAPFSIARADIRENPRRKAPGQLGAEAQALVSKYLVSELSKNLGPASAVRADIAPRAGWLISGEFTRISEGNRLARMAIGLGAGGTKMETRVQVSKAPGGGAPFLSFATSGGSNAMPGAATNPIPFSATASALAQSTQGVTDDAARTARMIVATIADYMAKHGWVAPGKVQKPKMASAN
jgi:hypothetical protein